ncbi:MAG: hypothetical protein JRJ29_14010 [Deltaproteobacteria bacterium]|nr:hypothetical protein [Deltaproteobacteria bacterium]
MMYQRHDMSCGKTRKKNPGKLPRAFDRFSARIRTYGTRDTVGLLLNVCGGMLDFYLRPRSKRQSKLPGPNYRQIKSDLERAGVTVLPYRVDVGDFKIWLEKASFPKNYVDSYGSVFVEKALEHYVGAQLLQLRKDDVLIDVAAAHSPWFEIAERIYGCTAYALDLIFKPGVNDKRIGSDATDMPIPDGFATKLALHCAFETFEGDSDTRLLPEACRVLAEGGQMVILPLYMHNLYFADSSPLADRRGLDYQGAQRIWRDDGYAVRFSRKYSVNAFLNRVVNHLGDLKLKIYYIENEKEVHSRCYLKFAASFEKAVSASG